MRLCPLLLRWILRTVFPLFRAINDAVTGHIEKLSTIMGNLVEEAGGEQYRCRPAPADSGENSGGGRGRGDLQWSLTFGPKLPHCGHRYCSPPASSTSCAMIFDIFSTWPTMELHPKRIRAGW